jgi:hypothetical protein
MKESTEEVRILPTLVVMFEEPDGSISCKISRLQDYDHRCYGIIICDLVRHVAMACNVDEGDVWQCVEKERRKPATRITQPRAMGERNLLVGIFEDDPGGRHHCILNPRYDHHAYSLIICDLVRSVAAEFNVDEDDVWEWVEKERRESTTKLTGKVINATRWRRRRQ